jgi:AcrR family transcriptional regulator
MPAATEQPPQLRADARRNHTRILEAARAAFSEHGSETHVAAIAERAGVGVGTLYRHFPTKEALLEALILDRLESLSEELAAARAEEPDAWSAFERFFLFAARLQVRDRSLMQFIAGAGTSAALLETKRAELYEQARRLVEDAQREGSMRADVEPGDLPLLLGGIVQVLAQLTARAEELGARCAAIVLDGLRAPGFAPLPGRALDARDIDQLFRGCGHLSEQRAVTR